MYTIVNLLSLTFLVLSAVFLIPLQITIIGWLLFIIGACITTFLCSKEFRKEIILVYISVGFLAIARISTDLTEQNMITMGIPLFLALAIPYTIDKYFYKTSIIQYNFSHERQWQMKEVLYILFTISVVYILLPLFLRITGSYHNWTVRLTPAYLFIFFIAINVVGAYDEVFFMSTVLKILRKHFPFFLANLAQSIIFTSFLYELGFRGVLFPFIFIFAFIQGIIFQKTNSLFYLITIHLSADFILYLSLIHAYYPTLMPIFLIQ